MKKQQQAALNKASNRNAPKTQLPCYADRSRVQIILSSELTDGLINLAMNKVHKPTTTAVFPLALLQPVGGYQ